MYDVLEVNPNHPEAYFFIGKSLMMEGKEDEANTIYQKILAIDPKDADACYGLAMNCSESDPQKAIDYCKKATEANPQHTHSRNYLGIILRDSGRLDEALIEHKKANAIRSNSGNSFYIGIIYYAKGDLENAKKYFDESNYLAHKQIERVVQLHWALYMMGVIEGLFGKLNESRRLIKKALEYNSSKSIRHGMKKHLAFLLKHVENNGKIKTMISFLGDDI